MPTRLTLTIADHYREPTEVAERFILDFLRQAVKQLTVSDALGLTSWAEGYALANGMQGLYHAIAEITLLLRRSAVKDDAESAVTRYRRGDSSTKQETPADISNSTASS